MNKNKILLCLIPILTIGLGGCGNRTNDDSIDSTTDVNSNSSTGIDRPVESVSQEEDIYKLIDPAVLEYEGDIDMLVYITGQNDSLRNIGAVAYKPEDIYDHDVAKYVAAAREFKKLAPGVNINVTWVTDDAFNETVISYNEQKGHYPHIMHPVNPFQEDLANGIITDLSQYSESEYYQAINPTFLDQMTYGGFVTGFPTHYAPYGMFTNKAILNEKFVIDSSDQNAYKEWVDNLTIEEFLDICETVYTPSRYSAIPNMSHAFISYIAPDIYESLAKNSSVNLSSTTVQDLIEIESEISKYSVFEYPRSGNDGKSDDGFNDVHPWNINQSFVDGKFAFATEMPWNVGVISQLAQVAEKGYNDFDYIPFPKLNKDAENKVGMKIGGLTIGNQCPIDNGVRQCTPQQQLETDVAAYFTMFLIADPRAIEAESKIEWGQGTADNPRRTGVGALPLTTPDFKFSWQNSEDSDIVDPAEGFESNYDYQLAQYLKIYNTYWDSSVLDYPDVVNFTNISYGFSKVLDIVKNHPENVINTSSVPTNVYEGSDVVDVMDRWDDRYTEFNLGTSTYVNDTLAALSNMTTYINDNMAFPYEFLQECVDNYYGSGVYTFTK